MLTRDVLETPPSLDSAISQDSSRILAMPIKHTTSGTFCILGGTSPPTFSSTEMLKKPVSSMFWLWVHCSAAPNVAFSLRSRLEDVDC